MKALKGAIASALLLASAASADVGQGIYFDPDRNGEGIVVHTEYSRTAEPSELVFYFFTYTGDSRTSIPPTVSPPPPPPVVSTELDQQAWYLGVSDSWDETRAVGTLYVTESFGYPLQVDVDAKPVGTFELIRNEDEGFRFQMLEFEPFAVPEGHALTQEFNFSTCLFGCNW